MRRRAIAVAVALGAVLGLFALVGGDDPEPEADPRIFCGHVARLGELVVAAASGPEEIGDVPAAQALVDDIATTADGLRAEAPDEIAEAAADLASVTAEVARELRDFYRQIVQDPARANDPAFLASLKPLNEDRRASFEAAGAKVRPWVAEHCAPSGSTTTLETTPAT
ncbi:MAG TPA: hypothetical protein VI916_00695 [Acidimicrobiia bacterium]|nr:hypothetical protein [Acidimicrobiia bacterium]